MQYFYFKVLVSYYSITEVQAVLSTSKGDIKDSDVTQLVIKVLKIKIDCDD